MVEKDRKTDVLLQGGTLLDRWGAPVDVFAGGSRLVEGKGSKAALVFSSLDDARRVIGSRDAFVLAEAYVHGVMDVTGDIYSAIGIKELFYPERLSRWDKARIVFNVLKSYRRHTLKHDREYIQHHYDHPDEFYALFLGDTMAYSCAYFADDDDCLDVAQARKINYLLRKLRLKPGDKLLDVGCGWGELVLRAASDYGASALGITLSATQYEYCRKKIRQFGLEDRCSVELRDFRELDPARKFDKIVSVGMYEHVGAKNLDLYFKRIHDLLTPSGIFVNHGITRRINPDWKRASEARFIDKYIFPGGELHPVSRVAQGMESAGFEVYDVESLRLHYAKTLRCWVRNLQGNKDKALKMVPERVYRAWVLYMAGCALAFEDGYLNVHQVSGSKVGAEGRAQAIMTRDYLYKSKSHTGEKIAN